MTPASAPALPQAFFLPVGDGQRLCLFHPPQGPAVRGRVLYLHPLAEEMNASRRMAALAARALAADGWAVLQIDLLGCGDSSGDLADATWAHWQNDTRAALAWLAEHATGPMWLWGLRSGALLAAETAATLAEPVHLLLWQGAASGQPLLQQFLRLEAASQWIGARQAQGRSAAQRLAAGETVQVAGYSLSPALAQGLGAARLRVPAQAPAGRLVWLDVSEQAELSPAAQRALSPFQTAGWQVQARAVPGPLFWQTVSGDVAPALIEATVQALRGPGP